MLAGSAVIEKWNDKNCDYCASKRNHFDKNEKSNQMRNYEEIGIRKSSIAKWIHRLNEFASNWNELKIENSSKSISFGFLALK